MRFFFRVVFLDSPKLSFSAILDFKSRPPPSILQWAPPLCPRVWYRQEQRALPKWKDRLKWRRVFWIISHLPFSPSPCFSSQLHSGDQGGGADILMLEVQQQKQMSFFSAKITFQQVSHGKKPPATSLLCFNHKTCTLGVKRTPCYIAKLL